MAGLQEVVSCSNNGASPQNFQLKQRQWQEGDLASII